MTVGELEERMSHREFSEWALVYKIENEQRQEAEMDAQLVARHRGRK